MIVRMRKPLESILPRPAMLEASYNCLFWDNKIAAYMQGMGMKPLRKIGRAASWLTIVFLSQVSVLWGLCIYNNAGKGVFEVLSFEVLRHVSMCWGVLLIIFFSLPAVVVAVFHRRLLGRRIMS